MIVFSVCLPSDALSQHLPSYLGFSYLGRGKGEGQMTCISIFLVEEQTQTESGSCPGSQNYSGLPGSHMGAAQDDEKGKDLEKA